MAMRHVVWVLDELTITDSKAFRVLISLAEWAHKITNEVPPYPIDEIIRRAGMSRSSVFNKLAELEKMGLITRQTRFNDRGRDTSIITLNIEKRQHVAVSPDSTLTPGESKNGGGIVQKSRGDSPACVDVQESSAIPSRIQADTKHVYVQPAVPDLFGEKVSIDGAAGPVATSASRKRGPKQPLYTTEFESFWNVYPRKQGKTEASITFADVLALGAVPAEIMAGAKRYAAYCDQERTPNDKIKMAQGWLNGSRWTDVYKVNQPEKSGRIPGII